jgi:hypothetical protein
MELVWRTYGNPVRLPVQPEERSSALVIPLPTEEFGRAFGGQVLVYQPHRGRAVTDGGSNPHDGPVARPPEPAGPGPGRDWQLTSSRSKARPRVLCAVGELRAEVLPGGLDFAVKFVPGRGLAGEWTTRYACGVTEGSRRASD